MSTTPLKHCPYCLREHGNRGRACSDWCERKIRGRAAYVTRSRKEATAKIMAGIQKRLRFVPQWRKVAMGDDSPLLEIFGPEVGKPIQPRHGETLDAE